MEDVAYPLPAAVAVALTARLLIHADWPTPLLLIGIACTAMISALAAAVAAPDIRASLVKATTSMWMEYHGIRRSS